MFIAYYLLHDGHDVILIDSNHDRVPTTVFNAGMITPSTGVVPSIGLAGILSPYFGMDGPVYISLMEIFRNLRWFQIGLRRGLTGYERAITALGKRSLQLYDEFLHSSDDGPSPSALDIDLIQGIVGLYSSTEHAREVAAQSGGRFLDTDEIARLGYKNLGGGAYAEHELSINPFKLFSALRKRVSSLGGRFVLGADAKLIEVGDAQQRPGRRGGAQPRRIECVTLHQEEAERLTADRYVIAAGAWTRELCASLGYDPLVLPARGLAMVFETGGSEVVRSPALLEDQGIGVIQHDINTVRLTSFFDMVGFDRTFAARRKRWMLDIAHRHITLYASLKNPLEGVGFRPCTPDQLPVIGRVPRFDNLYVASGNCRLGVTLAPGTADVIRNMIALDRGGAGSAAAAPPTVGGGTLNNDLETTKRKHLDPAWNAFSPARFWR